MLQSTFTPKRHNKPTAGIVGPCRVYDPSALGLSVAKVMQNETLIKCPLEGHNDKHASASFNLTTGLFYCFACQQGLNVQQLARLTGGDIEKVEPNKVATLNRIIDIDSWQWVLKMPLALNNSYLASRGVSNETVRKYGILDAVMGVGFVFRNAAGKATGVQIRKYQGEPRYLILGEKPPIWPMQNLERGCFAVEGCFGVLNADKYGIKAVSTVGAGVTGSTRSLLSNFNPNVVFDDDLPGYIGAAKLVLYSGATAIIPGAEADNVDWLQLLNYSDRTKNLKLLEQLSKDKVRFSKALRGVNNEYAN